MVLDQLLRRNPGIDQPWQRRGAVIEPEAARHGPGAQLRELARNV